MENLHATHFSHEHPLTLWKEDVVVDCKNCGKQASRSPVTGCSSCGTNLACHACRMLQRYPEDPFYYCVTCWGKDKYFYTVHQSCIELPQEIQLSIHPQHPLKFAHSQDNHGFVCYLCELSFSHSSSFKCDQCSFGVDYKCASRFLKYHEGRDRFDNLIHQHPLFHLDQRIEYQNCQVCKRKLDSPVYGCQLCEFCLHPSCFDQVNQGTHHPFHPFHSLRFKKLSYSDELKSICNACGSGIRSGCNYYECEHEVCDFQLHNACANLTPNIKYNGHKHDLTLVHIDSIAHKCEACSFDITGDYCARCVECDINYHVNCERISLLPRILYKNHEHILILVTEQPSYGEYYCDVCKKQIMSSQSSLSYYYCAECKYFADVQCVITELQLDDRLKIEHLSHEHRLVLYESNKEVVTCAGCEEDIYGTTPAYCCDPCQFYIHKSCAELQVKILQHPLHPDHPLAIPTNCAKQSHCNACNKQFNGFAYQCTKECDFCLDLDCVKLQQPSIQTFEMHEHQLTFFQKLYGNPECEICEFTPSNVSYLRCIECDINIHLLCFPLPETIKHISHKEHLLILMDYVGEDDTDEYCDYCEQKVHPKECVYGCEECHLVVDYKCVVKQVLLSLEGKCEYDVEFRFIDRDKPKQIIERLDLKVVFTSLTEEEKDQMNDMYNINKWEYEMDEQRDNFIKTLMDNTDGESEVLKDFFLFVLYTSNKSFDSVRAFEKFFSTVAVGEDSRFESTQEDFPNSKLMADLKYWKTVPFRDYRIVECLAPILSNLLDIYPDIEVNCSLTPNVKTIIFTNLCLVLLIMSKTKVEDVNFQLLFDCWRCFRISEAAGLKVKFAFDHLKKIWHARFEALAAIDRNEKLCRLHEDLTEHYERLDELEKEIKEAKNKIRNHIESSHNDKVRAERKRLLDALKLRKKTTSAGLLMEVSVDYDSEEEDILSKYLL